MKKANSKSNIDNAFMSAYYVQGLGRKHVQGIKSMFDLHNLGIRNRVWCKALLSTWSTAVHHATNKSQLILIIFMDYLILTAQDFTVVILKSPKPANTAHARPQAVKSQSRELV